MDTKILNELGGALQRHAEISARSVIESGDANEKRALESYIKDTLFANAPTLLASYATLESEYKPLVTGMTGLMSNVFAIIQHRQRIQEAQQLQKVEPAGAGQAGLCAEPAVVVSETRPHNVVSLGQP